MDCTFDPRIMLSYNFRIGEVINPTVFILVQAFCASLRVLAGRSEQVVFEYLCCVAAVTRGAQNGIQTACHIL